MCSLIPMRVLSAPVDLRPSGFVRYRGILAYVRPSSALLLDWENCQSPSLLNFSRQQSFLLSRTWKPLASAFASHWGKGKTQNPALKIASKVPTEEALVAGYIGFVYALYELAESSCTDSNNRIFVVLMVEICLSLAVHT